MNSIQGEDGKNMSNFRSVLALAATLVCVSCGWSGLDYCASLEERAGSSDVRSYLIGWVDQNVDGRTFSLEEAPPTGGMVPGGSWVQRADVEWDKVGFGEPSQVRLVESRKNVYSVYFGERSRKGFLVKLRSSDSFGVDSEDLSLVTDRFAVFCFTDR